MRPLLLLPLLVLAACQPRVDPGVTPAPQESVHIPGSNGGTPTTMAITRTTSPAVRVVAGSMETVWQALPAVYATLAIPVEARDAATRTIGNPALKVRRRLGEVPLGRYLDCGYAQGGPSADSYDIVLSVETRLRPVGADSTMVTTVIDGRARPVAFAGEYVTCSTRGQLERRFFDALGVQLHP